MKNEKQVFLLGIVLRAASYYRYYAPAVNDPAAEVRGIKYKKDNLRFPSPFPSPQRGEGKGEGADSGDKKC
jgi:hypothetical protein